MSFQVLVLLLLKLLPVIIVGALGVIRVITRIKIEEDLDKSGAFECGFDPKGRSRVPFSLRYFLLAVYFLIFDIEIVFLFPLVLLDRVNFVICGFILVFIIILFVGLIHEWREGSLR